MTEDKRLERIKKFLAEEQDAGKESYWWLSFVSTENIFLGVIIVKAVGLANATLLTHRLGINPGGEIQAVEIPKDLEDKHNNPEYLNKLLSKEELETFGLI